MMRQKKTATLPENGPVPGMDGRAIAPLSTDVHGFDSCEFGP